MTHQESFPERLKTYRKMMGWTQEELAKEWNYSSDAISAWERSVRTPNGQQIPRIARLLEIHPEELMKSINVFHDRVNSHKENTLTLDRDERDAKSALEAWGELQHVYRNRTEFNRDNPYVRMFEEAHEILATGISLNAIAMNYGRENIVKAVLERKTTISLCFLDPDGTNCAERERDLVVDEHGLGPLDVVVRGLDQLQQDVLDVLADIARLGQHGGVGDGERHIEHPGQRLGQKGLAAPGWAQQQDVGLGQLDLAVVRTVALRLDPLVVVVDGDRKDLLGVLLADDIVVQEFVDLFRLGEFLKRKLGGVGEFLGDDVVAQLDALVADVDTWPGDEFLHLLLRLAAEAALHQVAPVSELRHVGFPLSFCQVLSTTANRCPTLAAGRRPADRLR